MAESHHPVAFSDVDVGADHQSANGPHSHSLRRSLHSPALPFGPEATINDGQSERLRGQDREEGRVSQWTMDDVQCSPMVTNPRLLALPDLEKRNDKALECHIEKPRPHSKRARSASEGGGNEFVESTLLLPKTHHEDRNGKKKCCPRPKVKMRNETASTLSEATCSNPPTSPAGVLQPSNDVLQSLAEEFAREANPPSMSIMYGLINFSIVLPVLMSFGSIIYSDPVFRPYLPVLVKLTIVSGIVHQLCFSTFSSLPFAVGQVQDAGLIFLSSMASSIVRHCQDRGHDDEHILATVTIGLGLCTAVLGFGLVVIGKCRLAQYVQMLPTPVVGGYLAYIGFFCGQAGMALMAEVEVSGLADWGKFFTRDAFVLLLPGLVGGITIYVLVKMLRHMAVLPTCIVAMISLFYLVLGVRGCTIKEATEAGWISEADAPPVWYKTWDYLRFDRVIWSALPSQTLTLISMTFVVALSSSLDVAAIELELKRPLDYNHELKTVGISNVVSGLTGGYTGSYIFSQSIFSLRAGIRSRLAGYVLALCELVAVVIPVPILSYVPNFFFGSLLIMICIDLMYEWLWEVRLQVTNAEYGVALGTFVLIQITSVEYGILGGILVYVVCAKLGMDLGGKASEEQDEGTNGSILSGCENGGSVSRCDHLASPSKSGSEEAHPLQAGERSRNNGYGSVSEAGNTI